jgi:hypothetical protein
VPDDPGEGESTDELISTAIGILKAEQVVRYSEYAVKFIRDGVGGVFSRFSSDRGAEDIVEFNEDLLLREDQEIRIVRVGENVQPFIEKEEPHGSVVQLNLDAFAEEQQDEILSDVVAVEEDQGRILSPEMEQAFQMAEETRKDPVAKEILSHFSPYLSDPQLTLLRRSLIIRRSWESEGHTPKEQMRKWRGDLREKFGEKALTVTNFCSSGYYDEDGVLRQVMAEVDAAYEREYEVQDEYEEIVAEHPFVVYVGGEHPKAWEVKTDVRQRLREYDTYEYTIPFVELRGLGHENREIVKQVNGWLVNEYPALDPGKVYAGGEVIYRYHPSTLDNPV